MSLLHDERGRPTGLDWTVINARCPQDPAVWKKAATTAERNVTRLPDETEQRIVRLHGLEMTAVEIAKREGISAMIVGKVLTRRGVTTGRGRGARQQTAPATETEAIRMYRDGVSSVDIRAALKMSQATLYRILRRNNIPTRQSA